MLRQVQKSRMTLDSNLDIYLSKRISHFICTGQSNDVTAHWLTFSWRFGWLVLWLDTQLGDRKLWCHQYFYLQSKRHDEYFSQILSHPLNQWPFLSFVVIVTDVIYCPQPFSDMNKCETGKRRGHMRFFYDNLSFSCVLMIKDWAFQLNQRAPVSASASRTGSSALRDKGSEGRVPGSGEMWNVSAGLEAVDQASAWPLGRKGGFYPDHFLSVWDASRGSHSAAATWNILDERRQTTITKHTALY